MKALLPNRYPAIPVGHPGRHARKVTSSAVPVDTVHCTNFLLTLGGVITAYRVRGTTCDAGGGRDRRTFGKRLVDRHGPLNGDFLLTRLHYRVSTVHAVVRG